MLLSGDIEPGDRVTVDVTEGDLQFEVERGGAREEVSDWSDEAEEAKTPKSTAAR
jgi:ribosomal 50S subunit-recycling heat shock protein